jgi:hypothetical protein
MYAGEFAAIKVFRNADLDDALANGYDIVAGDIPMLTAQFGAAIDRAVIWGINKPREWANIESLWGRANRIGAVVNESDQPYVDIFGRGGVRDKILLSGYEPNGIVAALHMQGMLDEMKDDAGRPLFVDNLRDDFPFRLRGTPLTFARNGAWDETKAWALMADFSHLVYSIRQDLTARTTMDGTITNYATGEVHNLAQQNKTALIMHMRLGWQVTDPVTQMSNTPVPFAFYAPA